MAELVSHKAASIAGEYDPLVSDAADVAALVSFVDGENDRCELRKMIAVHLYVHAAGLRRRVLEPCEELPLLLMRLAESHFNQPCTVRQRVATIVMDTDDQDLDPTTRQVKSICKEDMRQAKADGTTGYRLYTISTDMRRRAMCTVRLNETINSQLKRMAEKSPNMSLGLCNARLGIKFFIGKTETCRVAKETSNMQALATMGATLLKTCMDVKTSRPKQRSLHSELQVTLADRYGPPPPITLKDVPKELPSEALQYGRAIELLWRQTCLDLITVREPLAIEICKKTKKSLPDESCGLWMTMDHVGYRCIIGIATWLDGQSSVELTTPLKTGRLADVFADHHAPLRAGSQLVRTHLLRYDFDGPDCIQRASVDSGAAVRSLTLKTGVKLKTKAPAKASAKASAAPAAAPAAPSASAGEPASTPAGDISHDPPAPECVAAVPVGDKSLEDYLGDYMTDSEDGVPAEVLEHIMQHAPDEQEPSVEISAVDFLDHDDRAEIDRYINTEKDMLKHVLSDGQVVLCKDHVDHVCEDLHGNDVDPEEVLLNHEKLLGILETPEAPEFSGVGADLLDMWHSDATEGLACLQEMHDLNTTYDVGAGVHRHLSLVEHPDGQLLFVHWANPAARMGREVYIDWPTRGIKTLLCVGSRRHDTNYSDCRIVLNSIGTSMHKAKEEQPKRHRPLEACSRRARVPERVVRIMRMWQTTTATAFGDTTCFICNGPDAPDGVVMICCLCLKASHSHCSDSMLDAVSDGTIPRHIEHNTCTCIPPTFHKSLA